MQSACHRSWAPSLAFLTTRFPHLTVYTALPREELGLSAPSSRPAGFQGERKFDNRRPQKCVAAATPTLASVGVRPAPQSRAPCSNAHRVVFCIPFAEPVSWWERPRPTPASQTSWRGEPSITVLGPPRGPRSASRYRSTPPVSDICHSQRWALVSKNQSHPSVNSPVSSYSFGLPNGSVLWAVQVPREISLLKPEREENASDSQRGNNILTWSICIQPSNLCFPTLLR